MKARLCVWGVVTAAFVLIVYQNQEFYLSEQTLSLNLFTKIDIPPVANVTHVLVFFLAGLLLASISFYHERFKLRRRIKKLDTAFSSCAVEVAEIKSAEREQPTPITSRLMDRFRRKRDDIEPMLPETTGLNTASD